VILLLACAIPEDVAAHDVGLAVATVMVAVGDCLVQRENEGLVVGDATERFTLAASAACGILYAEPGHALSTFDGNVDVSVTWGPGACEPDDCQVESWALTIAPDVLFHDNTFWGEWDGIFDDPDDEMDWDPPDFALTGELSLLGEWRADPEGYLWDISGSGRVRSEAPVEGDWSLTWSQHSYGEMDSGGSDRVSAIVGGVAVAFDSTESD
jgi:hypothetical protein